MKKFYYLSKFKIQSIDLKNYRLKFLGLVFSIFAASLVLISGVVYIYSTFISPPKDLAEIKSENELLKGKLNSLLVNYKDMESKLDSLHSATKTLRVTANLAPIEESQRTMGFGGKVAGSISDVIEGKNPDLKSALDSFDSISKKFEFEKRNVSDIQSAFSKNIQMYKSIPAIQPCDGELSENGFGMRMHPILHTLMMHEGIDIVTDVGTPVVTSADGIVEYTGIKSGYGLCVEVNHGFGYKTRYGHLSKVLVKEGQRLTRGTELALSGNSGLSTGPHLHYEVSHNGTSLDPVQFFFTRTNLFSSK